MMRIFVNYGHPVCGFQLLRYPTIGVYSAETFLRKNDTIRLLVVRFLWLAVAAQGILVLLKEKCGRDAPDRLRASQSIWLNLVSCPYIGFTKASRK
jgi:hypothetical protein